MAENKKPDSVESARKQKAKDFEEKTRQEKRDKAKEKANKGLLDSFKDSFFGYFDKQSNDEKNESKEKQKETQNFFTKAFGGLGKSIGNDLNKMKDVLGGIDKALTNQYDTLKSAIGNFTKIFTNNPISAFILGILGGILKLYRWMTRNDNEDDKRDILQNADILKTNKKQELKLDEVESEQSQTNSWLRKIFAFLQGKEDTDLTDKIEEIDRHKELLNALSDIDKDTEKKLKKPGILSMFEGWWVWMSIKWTAFTTFFIASWDKMFEILKKGKVIWIWLETLPNRLNKLGTGLINFVKNLPTLFTNFRAYMAIFWQLLRQRGLAALKSFSFEKSFQFLVDSIKEKWANALKSEKLASLTKFFTTGKMGKFIGHLSKIFHFIGRLLPPIGFLIGAFSDSERLFGKEAPRLLRLISGLFKMLSFIYLEIPAWIIDSIGKLFGFDFKLQGFVQFLTDSFIIFFKNIFDWIISWFVDSPNLRQVAGDAILDAVPDLFVIIGDVIRKVLEFLWDLNNLPLTLAKKFLGLEDEKISQVGVQKEPSMLDKAMSWLIPTADLNDPMRGIIPSMGDGGSQQPVIIQNITNNAMGGAQASYTPSAPMYVRNDDDSLLRKFYQGWFSGESASYGIRG